MSGHFCKAPIALIIVLSICSAAYAQSNCDLKRPSKTADVDVDDGVRLFLYPGTIGKSYSGCQTMWSEHNEKVLVFTYEQGLLKQFVQYGNGQPVLTCIYEKEKSLTSNSSECPEYEQIARVFRHHKSFETIKVPPNRDPGE